MITGGRDDVDAGASGGFDRLHERIGFGGLVDWMTKRQVDDLDAKPILVGSGVLDRADDVAGASLPVSVEHLSTIKRALGATPRYRFWLCVPSPAMRPATWVPWP